MDLLDFIFILISIVVSIAIIILTYYLYHGSKLQFVALLTSAFQDQWHSPRAVLMRDYLHSKEFEKVFNHAILEAYETKISYSEIDKLLKESELKGKTKNSNRLKKFDSYLKKKYLNTNDYVNFPFSSYQALYEVLLSFDRVAIFRDIPYMMNICIRRYKPPIRDLSTTMQAFIAIRIMLREPDLKNYKKDYMHLLGLLSINPLDSEFPLNLKLFNICKEGLKGRKELSGDELISWKDIIEKRRDCNK